IEQGLPQSSVYAIAQTPDGYLWAGTEEGLVRFDGVQLTVYDRTNTPAFPETAVRALATDTTGALWIGFANHGLVRMDRGVFRGIEGLSNELVRAILSDRDGSTWVGTAGG